VATAKSSGKSKATANDRWGRRLAVPAAVGALLAAFFVLALTSVLHKSVTYDEPVHLAGGYSYWVCNDYRINPENGILPQRWMALPLLLGRWDLGDINDPPRYDEWQMAYRFLYESGNDLSAMLLLGRGMVALLGVGLGLLVYRWSAGLFGRAGGLVSLALYAFSPAILANGRLMTSDLAASLCFLASLWCLWRVLHRVSVVSVLCSCLAVGALFVSKMSALLIAPMVLCLLAVRLFSGRPLEIAWGGTRYIAGRIRQILAFLGLALLHVTVIYVVIWAFYGFRYESLNTAPPEAQTRLDDQWQGLTSQPFPGLSAILFCREHRLLPEAFLQGHAHVLKYAQIRAAFLNGQYSVRGWWRFFPYCFLVKTPLSLFVVLILAVWAMAMGWRRAGRERGGAMKVSLWRGFYRTAPLWVLLAVYWAFAITSKLNIGHRHILPTYPPMFILAGAAAGWLAAPIRRKLVAILLSLAAIAYAGESLAVWPNYLAYFNPLAGGSGNAYRHLVDSSLDWGQDTPGLADWLEKHGLAHQDKIPVYLAYFGTGSPTYYGIKAHRLRGFPDIDLKSIPMEPLVGGVYCISATMLQSVLLTNCMGQWTQYNENAYQSLASDVDRLFQAGPEGKEVLMQPQWQEYLQLFLELRFGRLCAYLRQREPDDNVGHSILIYRLRDQEAREALFGPPAELLPDRVPTKDKLLAK